jgi:hypothetical protein
MRKGSDFGALQCNRFCGLLRRPWWRLSEQESFKKFLNAAASFSKVSSDSYFCGRVQKQ